MGNLYIRHLQNLLSATNDDTRLFDVIVNAPFHDKIRSTTMDLGIIMLLLVDSKTQTINLVAMSNTEQAAGAIEVSEKPFKDIQIPLNHPTNLIARAIQTNIPQHVTDWKYLFSPILNADAARFDQAGAGIEYSFIVPLGCRKGGAVIFSYYQESKNIRAQHRNFINAYSKMVEVRLSGERLPYLEL